MAIKIKKSPKWEPQTLTCLNCSTIVEVEKPEDFKSGMLGSGMDDSEEFEIYVKCPVCGNYIWHCRKKTDVFGIRFVACRAISWLTWL